MLKGVTIGALASRMGVQTSAVRYYERQGLIVSERLGNGYRVYTQDAVNALRFICRAKALGFSLEQIGEILQIRRRDVQPCARVRGLIERNLADVDRKIGELSRLRRELKGLAGAGVESTSPASVCPIIETAKQRPTQSNHSGKGARATQVSKPQPT